MIDLLRPYGEMKQSELPWLGDVPAHWDVRRAKRMLKPIEVPVRSEDDIVTCFCDGQVTLRKNRRASGFMIALLEQGYQGVRIGQLVVHSMDAFAGAIGISDSDGKCTPKYIVCDPREPETRLSSFVALTVRESNSPLEHDPYLQIPEVRPTDGPRSPRPCEAVSPRWRGADTA